MLSVLMPCSSIYANEVLSETHSACLKLPQYQQAGQRAYMQKRYAAAVKAYTEQAAWSDYCRIMAEDSPIRVNERMQQIAYNNVGLSYAKWGKPLWALAWYQITPNSNTTQFNRIRLLPLKAVQPITGHYVQYAGQGAWNRLVIKAHKGQYAIEWIGLNMKTNGLMMGPNIGEIQFRAAQSLRQLQYREGNCKIDMTLGEKTALGQRRVVMKSTGDLSDCGFGNGVVAQGEYVQVEQ